ncbi:MAG TPA: hypothetical protein VIE91_01065 [Methylophilaceae bacterium]|jgi:hypothetical protein
MKLLPMYLVTSLLIIACSPNSAPAPSEPEAPKPTAIIAKPQRDVLDKAKGVQTTVDQSTDETKQQVDKQTE